MSLYQLGWKTPKEEGERREIKEGNKPKMVNQQYDTQFISMTLLGK